MTRRAGGSSSAWLRVIGTVPAGVACMNSVPACVAGVTLLRQARIARSGLIVEGPAISAVSKCEQQEHNHGDDGHACSPADAHSLLRLGMEIESAWRFDRLVVGTIVCVHG